MLAKAVILADEATGQVLFERNAGAARAMASTTKVMTALLALERLDERKVVTIGAGPPQVGEESLRLQKGERLTVRQLLLGLLLKSANDAGVALAEAVDGSEAAFVRRMNRKAAALRLSATRYVTPYGLDRPGHQTSARDLARLWEVAMRRADFRSLVTTRSARIPGSDHCRFVDLSPRTSCSAPTGGRSGARPASPTGPDAAWSPRPAAAAAAWSRSRSGPPTPSPTSRRCSNTASPSSSGSAWPSRGQPVSAGPGRPAELQTTTAADALVRLDQLDQVRLTIPSGSSGGAGGEAALFTSGERRLVRVGLDPLPGTGPTPTSTLVPTPTNGGSGPAAPAGRGRWRAVGREARRGRPSPRERSFAWARCPPELRRRRSTRSSSAPLHDLHRQARPPTAGGAGRPGMAGGGAGGGRRPVAESPIDEPPTEQGGERPEEPGGGEQTQERPAVRLLVDQEAVQGRVAELGAELRADYQGVEPILVSVLRGGVVFLADLVRAAGMPCLVDFMAISRFDASEDTGVVRIEKDLDLDLSGAHVLVVEDIVDTGLTLTYLLRVLATRGPASLRVCALLDKRARRIVDVPLSYVGFEVPDVFLVGYGLDLDERERGRRELLAVDDLEAVRADPALLDRPTRPDGAWRPPGA